MDPGVFYQRNDGTLTDANPAALKMFGITHEQFIGKDSYAPQWKVISETGEVLAPGQHPSMIALQTGKPVRDLVVGVFNPERDAVTWVRTNATPLFRPGEVVPYQVFVTMDDITDLKRTRASLVDNEERFRELFTRMPAAVAIYEASGNGEDFIFKDFNAAAEAIEGIKKSDLVGKRVSQVFPGVTEFGLFEVFKRVWKTGEAEYYPTALYRDERDPGTWRENWVYRLESGEIIAIYHDITKRVQAEEALQQTAERLVMATQAGGVGIWELDLVNNLLIWDDQMFQLYGITPDTFSGTYEAWRAGLHPDDLAQGEADLQRAIRGEKKFDTQFRVVWPDGSIHYLHANARVDRDAVGRPKSLIGTNYDITERKRAEDALKESEERLRQIAENSPAVFYVHDRVSNQFIYVSPAYKKVWGKPGQELIDDPYSFLQAVHPEDLPSVQEAIRMELEEGAYFDREYRIIQPGGTIRWIHSRNFPVINEQGTVYRVIGTAEDITLRKEAEDALLESEGKLNAMLQSIGDPMSMMDMDLNIIWANETAERYFGKELAGRKCYEVYHQRQDPCKPYPCIALKAFQDGEIHRHETIVIDSQGQTKFFECSANVALKNENGKPVTVLEISRDITERKLAEAALIESEDRFRKIFENSPAGMALITPDFRFFSVNPSFLSMTRYSEEELRKMSFKDITHPDHLAIDLEHIQEQVEGSIPVYRTEKQYIRKDGSILWGSLRVITIRDKQGSLLFFTAQVEDITGRKLAEDALRASEEKLAMVIDGVPILIAYVDTELRFVYMNKAYADWYGRTREELVGNRVEDLLDKDVFERALPAYRAALGGKAVSMENHVRDTRGNERFVSVRLAPHFSGKEVSGFFATIMDITDRRVAENALAESEVKFRTMVEASPDMIWEIDLQGNFTYISSQSIVQMGYEPGELIGGSFFSLIRPESVSSVKTAFLEHIQEKSSLSPLEVPAHDKKGNQIFIEIRSAPIIGSEGKLVGFRGIARDITSRKVSEEVLTALNAYNRSLIEASLDPLVTISHDGKIRDLNAATEKVTGYSRSELIGTDFSDYFVDTVKAKEGYQEVFRKGIVRDYPLEIRHRDGSITSVLYNATLYRDPQGKPLGIFAAARDISELKAAQEELHYSEQKYRDLAELMPQTIFETDLSGRFTYANRFALTLFGYDHSDLKRGLDISQMVVPEDVDRAGRNLEDIVRGGKSGNEYRFRLRNGDTFTGITYISVIEKGGLPVGLRGIIADISERKHIEDVLRLSHTLLDCANRTLELPALLHEYVHIIQDYTGCEAVGIRLLDEQGNIPYQAYTGFSHEFYSTESPLSIKSDECMCIYVIRGTTDPTQPFFTDGGSFYMNGTTKFLSTVSEEDKGRTRNVCNKTGYESVALVPLRQGDRITGLIHLADRRENLVPLKTVQVIEEIAGPIGSAIQRVTAETQVRESLAEKEILLREIHHRVKNNLARVISLIGLQKAQLSDPDNIARFRDLESRIRSMSLVHESLYHSDSLSRINAQEYAEDLVQHLIQSYGPRADIRWNIRMGDTHLPIDTAVHCGLIITEIVTNSLKYAFPEGWSCQEERGMACEISLSMEEKDGFIILNASDNGRGIPPGNITPSPRSLGLSLIRILAKNQLHGDLKMDTTRGTSFEVRFVREQE